MHTSQDHRILCISFVGSGVFNHFLLSVRLRKVTVFVLACTLLLLLLLPPFNTPWEHKKKVEDVSLPDCTITQHCEAVGIPTLYHPLYHLNLHFKSSPSGGESHHSGREARGSPPGSTHLIISGVPRRGSPPGSTHLIILGYPYNKCTLIINRNLGTPYLL